MDTRTVSDAEVQQHIAEIKAYMPETYKAIQLRAADHKGTFEAVRRAIRGEPNCFWAVERGWVKGTPFSMHEIAADVALAMVQWGSAYVCIFGTRKEG